MSLFSPANVPLIGLDSASVFRIDASSYGAAPTATAALNTTAIQAALTACVTNGGGVVTLMVPGTYLISDTLLIGSNTTFTTAPGVSIKASPLMNKPVLTTSSYARSDVNVSSLTSSGTTATCTTATAHGLAVGDFVCVNWALPEFYSGVFIVATVPSATQFTYGMYSVPTNGTASAGSGGTIKVRKADTNIKVLMGGNLNYDSSSQSTSGLTAMNCILSHVSGLEVSGGFQNALKYNLLVACAANVDIHDIVTKGVSDGVHLTGPINGATVNGIQGNNGDNVLAAGCGDYSNYLISEGAISGFTGGNVWVDNNAQSVVRLWGTSAYSFDGVIDGVYGSANNKPLVECIQDPSVVPDANSWIRRLIIRNVRGSAGGEYLVSPSPKTCDYIEIDNVEETGNYLAGYAIRLGSSSSTFTKAVIKNCTKVRGADTGGIVVVGSASTATEVIVDNCNYVTTSSGQLVDVRGTCTNLALTNCYAAGGGSSKMVNTLSTSALSELRLENCVSNTVNWVVNHNAAADLEIEVAACVLRATSGNVFRHAAASGVMRIRSSSTRYPSITQAVVRTSTGTFEVYGWDVPLDPLGAAMATTNGQFCNSTRAGAINQGMATRAFSIGAWYALATGAAGVNTAIT